MAKAGRLFGASAFGARVLGVLGRREWSTWRPARRPVDRRNRAVPAVQDRPD